MFIACVHKRCIHADKRVGITRDQYFVARGVSIFRVGVDGIVERFVVKNFYCPRSDIGFAERPGMLRR